MVHDDGPVGLDQVRVAFDDERVVSDAGIALAATLAQRLGIEGLVDRFVLLEGHGNSDSDAWTGSLGAPWSMTVHTTPRLGARSGEAYVGRVERGGPPVRSAKRRAWRRPGTWLPDGIGAALVFFEVVLC